MRRRALVVTFAAIIVVACDANTTASGTSTGPGRDAGKGPATASEPDAAADAGGDSQPTRPGPVATNSASTTGAGPSANARFDAGVGGASTSSVGDAAATGETSSTGDAGGAAGNASSGADDGGGAGATAPHNPSDDVRDGERLRRLVFASSDGRPVTMGIEDTQLGIRCSFRRAADDVMRCLPDVPGGAAWAEAATQGESFPYYVAGNSACPPSYALVPHTVLPTSCDVPAGDDVFTVGDTASESCSVVDAMGDCSFIPKPPDSYPDAEYFTAVEEVDPSTFVAGTIELGDGGRIRSRFIDGEDGSRFFWDLYDVELDTSCEFARASDGVVRCLPTPRDLPETTVDENEPFRFANSACLQPYAGLVDDGGGFACEPMYSVHQPETTTEICGAFLPATGECASTATIDGAADGAVYEFAGDEVPPAGFSPGTLTMGEGQRVRIVRVQTDQGLSVDVGWYDAVTEAPCAWQVATDEVLRCLPTTLISRDTVVADPETGGYARPWAIGNASCPPSFVVGNSQKPGASGSRFECGPQLTVVYAVDEASPTLCEYQAPDGSCTESTSPGADAPEGAMFYSVGAEQDPTMFVAAELAAP